MLEGVSTLYAARGKKVVKFDLRKETPEEDELKKLILGPTGNLRAPSLRKGKTLIVGFNQDLYEEIFV